MQVNSKPQHENKILRFFERIDNMDKEKCVPYIVVESTMFRAERTAKRLAIALTISGAANLAALIAIICLVR